MIKGTSLLTAEERQYLKDIEPTIAACEGPTSGWSHVAMNVHIGLLAVFCRAQQGIIDRLSTPGTARTGDVVLRFRDEIDAGLRGEAFLQAIQREPMEAPAAVRRRELCGQVGTGPSSGDKMFTLWINDKLSAMYLLFRDSANFTVLVMRDLRAPPPTPGAAPLWEAAYDLYVAECNRVGAMPLLAWSEVPAEAQAVFMKQAVTRAADVDPEVEEIAKRHELNARSIEQGCFSFATAWPQMQSDRATLLSKLRQAGSGISAGLGERKEGVES